MSYPFLKGHGTENDFVLLPDHDGLIHGDLAPSRVAALCDRRAGIGGDGVVRVVRATAVGEGPGAEWFMDYRNADGSLAEMCGNGIRVLARHLLDEGLVTGPTFQVATRAGLRSVTVDGPAVTVDMGTPAVLGETTVSVAGRTWPARHVSMGNPHAVAFVEDLRDAGALLDPPGFDPTVYPRGVNVEFVARRGVRHVAMRVHERGSGETRSCGTGACAVMVASALADGAGPGETYRVDVPGGELSVTWTAEDRVLLTGPAVIVARGTTDL
ncbi:MAG TPA: diaminopimelate epimerase [Nocardioides sp.]|uniref:diaminopimelate epimerase n=1 Tax=Nocardioides sp. TaxID=35761 RepID=UPI002C8AD447|nr:diaminopimelate epimerase [Nocardioides sp.]HQR28700.1 diaminopimelate epimerase [Nocardioides sp.]